MKYLKSHILILLSFIFLSCNWQETIQINPTIQINDNGYYFYKGVQMSPSDISKNIKEEFGTNKRINLLISQKSKLKNLADLKTELLKARFTKLSYSAISSIQSDFDINGIWYVRSVVNSPTYTVEINDNYLNQIIEISHYQFSQNSNLSILENFNNNIPIATISNEIISEEEFQSLYRFSIDKLEVKGKSLKEVDTNLSDHPFSSIIITELNELILGWDGLYLRLEKQ